MSGMFEYGLIERIQQANDIVDIISEHVSLKKKGLEMVGLCPFHQDHSPSMCVSSTKQIFKCFACGAGGDVFKFLQMRENLSFPQAVERLGQRAGIEVESLAAKGGEKSETQEVDPNRLAKANKWAAEYFIKNFNDPEKGKAAREYVGKRQINNASVEKWMIGLACSDNDLAKFAREKKAPTDVLVKGGLLAHNGMDKFTNRLMFPIADATGRIIGFGGRTLDNADAKYINSPTTVLFDKSNSLYGLFQARHEIVKKEQVIVVEGYTDCIMAHQAGCCNVVATLGTSFTAGHVRMLKRFAKSIVLLFDSDTAGQEAGNRALDLCLTLRIDIKVAAVPQGKDPCDYIIAVGKEGFQTLIDNAVDVFEYKWRRLTESLKNEDTITARKTAIEEYLQTVATAIGGGNLSAIEKGLMVNKLAGVVGMESKDINSELNKRIAKVYSNQSVKNQQVKSVKLGDGLHCAAQREIVEVLLNEPSLLKSVGRNLSAEDFDVPQLKFIVEKLFEGQNRRIDVTLSQILAQIEGVELAAEVVDIAESGREKGNFSRRLEAAVGVIERLRTTGNKTAGKGRGEEEALRNLGDKKPDRHNIGMI